MIIVYGNTPFAVMILDAEPVPGPGTPSGGTVHKERSVPPRTTLLIDFKELLNGAVIGRFHIFGEIAGRKLPVLPVAVQTVTANPLLGARIGAIAIAILVLILFAIHNSCLKGYPAKLKIKMDT
jgi:hypothetical protein